MIVPTPAFWRCRRAPEPSAHGVALCLRCVVSTRHVREPPCAQMTLSSSPKKSSISAVSWEAIAAGAGVSAALSLFLLHPRQRPRSGERQLLIQFRRVHDNHARAEGIALVLMAVMASSLAGYLAAWLRTRWPASTPTKFASVPYCQKISCTCLLAAYKRLAPLCRSINSRGRSVSAS